jgi:hypothetical protein
MEAFKVSQRDAYGSPPLSKGGKNPHHLDGPYVAQAEKDVAMQLSKAGVRLAYVLRSTRRIVSRATRTIIRTDVIPCKKHDGAHTRL